MESQGDQNKTVDGRVDEAERQLGDKTHETDTLSAMRLISIWKTRWNKRTMRRTTTQAVIQRQRTAKGTVFEWTM